jgi:hypothetical protein
MSFSWSSMRRRTTTFGLLALLALLALGLVAARAAHAQSGSCSWDIPEVGPCAEVDLQFERRFTGTYRPGEPYDVLTILPDGSGETLSQIGIRLRLRIRCCYFDRPLDPVAGFPAEEIVLYDTHLCIAMPMHADRPTDADGYTEFTGTMAGGGCAESLMLYLDGSYAGTIPIRINSPDTGSASACLVDQSDLAAFAARLGNPAQYSICFDYNESGTIDASDLAFFAAALGKGIH